jgi:hypothetical protein
MLVFNYKSKKQLKENIGYPLEYFETSIFGDEYTKDGILCGSNRPQLTGHSREFFAEVELKNNLIVGVK